MISYNLKINNRSRRLRLAVSADGKVNVTAPRFATQYIIEKFINEKSDWIQGRIDHYKTYKSIIQDSRENYLKYKEVARSLAHKKVEHFNQFYKFKYNNISIKNQKTCWGSCSRKGNLNFNYKIALIPDELADYIVAHEVCHLKEFNHSKKFWDLLEMTVPDYKEKVRQLKMIGVVLN